MPNRILKESICSSENIDQLTPFEETVFYRLIVNCDDFGRMDARQKILKANLFPLKEITQHELEQAIRSLILADLVIPYEVDGKPYYQIKTWTKHQQVRIKKGKYPAPSEGVIMMKTQMKQAASDVFSRDQTISDEICEKQMKSDENGIKQTMSDENDCKQMISDEIRRPPESNPIQSKKNQNPKRIQSRARTRMREEAFARFWREYPRRESKKTAKQAFDKLDPDPELFQEMLDAIANWKKTDQWQKNDGQFIPHPATWLNQRRWEDELPKTTAGSGTKTVAAQQYEQRRYEIREETPEEILARLQADQSNRNPDQLAETVKAYTEKTPEQILAALQRTTGKGLFVPPRDDVANGMPEKKEEDTEA